ncbi:hypothetical protein [Octadecabacter temperatus]|uniref:hypothetical protein n=1 Tax=Octadecabacter temperatus TaxID=1458307 RepID=UPI000676301E|nr:hypothetical protein [Octadecabacter temperatus]
MIPNFVLYIKKASMKMRASLMRAESRGSHFRLDYPDTDDVNRRAWIKLYQGTDGSMRLEQ